jgi:hypothetical protein
MPDEIPITPPVPQSSSGQAATAAANPAQTDPTINIGEEFGTAQKNLPSVKIVAIVLGVVAVVLGVWAFVLRPKPQGGGSIDNVAAIEIPDQNAVLVAVNVTVHNSGKKPLWIKDIKATLKTDSGEFNDEAASAMDFDRYFQAFPALKEHTLPPLRPETRIPPGDQAQGTVVVSFPVIQPAFEKRQSLSVVIQPYDQALPVVLTK